MNKNSVIFKTSEFTIHLFNSVNFLNSIINKNYVPGQSESTIIPIELIQFNIKFEANLLKEIKSIKNKKRSCR